MAVKGGFVCGHFRRDGGSFCYECLMADDSRVKVWCSIGDSIPRLIAMGKPGDAFKILPVLSWGQPYDPSARMWMPVPPTSVPAPSANVLRCKGCGKGAIYLNLEAYCDLCMSGVSAQKVCGSCGSAVTDPHKSGCNRIATSADTQEVPSIIGPLAWDELDLGDKTEANCTANPSCGADDVECGCRAKNCPGQKCWKCGRSA